MFVLLFSLVFGGAIEPTDGSSYREFLMGGIFAMTMLLGGIFTASGLAEDMQLGIIDRFRSLPMSRAAVLIGRTASDVMYNVLSLIVMSLTGLLTGWRIHSSALNAIAGSALLLLFAYAFSWVMAYIGLLVPSPEVVNNSSYLVIMPLTFLSNAFVPLESFSGILRHIVEWNPVSAVTQAARELFGNTHSTALTSGAWSLQHPVAYSLIWAAAFVGVFLPMSVHQYRRANG